MRAGLLSQNEVIEYLNRYFIAVYVDANDSKASPEERRLYQTANQSKLRLQGHIPAKRFHNLLADVVVLILDPQGVCIDGINAARQPQEMMGVLRDVVRRSHVASASGRRPLLDAKRATSTDLCLNLTARFLPSAAARVPVGHAPQLGPFGVAVSHHPAGATYVGEHFASLDSAPDIFDLRLHSPTADRLLLSASQWHQLLGPGAAPVGTSWTVPTPLCKALLHLFRPPTHNCHPRSSEVQEATLTATMQSRNRQQALVFLKGAVTVEQPWYPPFGDEPPIAGIPLNARGRDLHWAQASVVGWLRYDAALDRVTSFQAATTQALYKGQDGICMPFACVLYTP